jgi:hypothetical protein
MVKPRLAGKRGLYPKQRRFTMRTLITALIILSLFAGILAVTGQEVIDLSTLNMKPTNVPTVNLDVKRTSTATSDQAVLDLSTLNKSPVLSNANMVSITGPAPTTFTPMFAIRNANISTNEANTIFTPFFAIRNSNVSAGAPDTVFTLPVAIGNTNQTA